MQGVGPILANGELFKIHVSCGVGWGLVGWLRRALGFRVLLNLDGMWDNGQGHSLRLVNRKGWVIDGRIRGFV